MTGSAPPVQLAAGFGAGMARCGDQLCALRNREAVCLDRVTGDVLWHRPAGPGILEASEGGVIVKKHGAMGECLSVQRRYICPEKDGFVVHHY